MEYPSSGRTAGYTIRTDINEKIRKIKEIHKIGCFQDHELSHSHRSGIGLIVAAASVLS